MAKWVYKKYYVSYTEWSSEQKTFTEYKSRPSWWRDTGYREPPVWTGSRYIAPESGDGWYRTPCYGDISNGNMRCEFKRYYGRSATEYEVTTYYRTRSRIMGSYIGEVIAEDGTYPNNGISGSYWYVKDRLAFPTLGLNINGLWKTAEMGWVNINGVWRNIEGIYVNVNGVWKQAT